MDTQAHGGEPAALPSATLVLLLGALQLAVLIILLMLALPGTSLAAGPLTVGPHTAGPRTATPCATPGSLGQPQADTSVSNCLRPR